MNSLTTYSPFHDFGLLPSRLAGLVDSLFRDGTSGGSVQNGQRLWCPSVNVSEDDAGYSITADLPEVNSGDVKVIVRDGVLTIEGERKSAGTTDGKKYHLVERSYGSFQRSFTLPKNAAGDKVSAAFKNGVLTVTVPKREEVKPREIEIKAS